jgi:hypothetical protein
VLHAKTTRVDHEIDYLGASVLSAAVVALILMLTWGGTEYAWSSPAIILLGVGSVILFAIFIAIERRATEPIVPLHLFGNKVFRVAFSTGALVGFAMFGALTFLPLFLQIVHGASPTSSGLQLVPIMLFVLAMAVYSGRRISATGTYRRFPITGTALTVIALFLFSHIGTTTPFWQTAIYMAFLGAGLGLTMQVLLIAAQNSVDYAELGVATSLATFSRSIGGSIGVAVFGTIFNNRLTAYLPQHVPAAALSKLHGASVTANPTAVKHLPPPVRHGLEVAFSDSLHVVFLAAVPFAVIAFLLALLLREVPLRTTMGPGAPEPSGAELGEAFGMAPPPEETSDQIGGPVDGEHESLSPQTAGHHPKRD